MFMHLLPQDGYATPVIRFVIGSAKLSVGRDPESSYSGHTMENKSGGLSENADTLAAYRRTRVNGIHNVSVDLWAVRGAE